MSTKKRAVIEDFDAFLAFLAATPLMIEVARKIQQEGRSHQHEKLPQATTNDLADALKSMA